MWFNSSMQMVMVARDFLDPQNVGDIIDQALVPSEPSATQLIDFSTETISVDKFKEKHPFVFLPHHVETPVHVFTSGRYCVYLPAKAGISPASSPSKRFGTTEIAVCLLLQSSESLVRLTTE